MNYNVSGTDQVRLNLGRPFYPAKWLLDAFRNYLFRVCASTENWWDVLLVYFNKKSSAEIRFKDGRRFELNRKNLPELLALVQFYALPEDLLRKYVRKAGKEDFTAEVKNFNLVLPFTAASVIREAYDNIHSGANSKGRIVVDVGAFNGDSAIYYVAVEGAKHVYAYEPVEYLFKTAKQIIKRNRLEKRITISNAAVTSGDSYREELNKGFDKSAGRGSKVDKPKAVTLETVLKKIDSSNPVLKLDCEGYEYDIVLTAPGDILRKFGTIYIEYHYGYRDLAEKLEFEGFETTHTSPTYRFRGFNSKPMICGVLVAQRLGKPKR